LLFGCTDGLDDGALDGLKVGSEEGLLALDGFDINGSFNGAINGDK